MSKALFNRKIIRSGTRVFIIQYFNFAMDVLYMLLQYLSILYMNTIVTIHTKRDSVENTAPRSMNSVKNKVNHGILIYLAPLK